MASFGAWAGLGGLNVQSHLGEPFLGTITVTGEEARTLLNGGRAAISNSNLRVSVRKSNADKAIINIRSVQPIQDPVLVFKVGVGNQSREYTAIIDPAGYSGRADGSARIQNNTVNQVDAAPADTSADRQAARERINRVIRNDNTNAAAPAPTAEAPSRRPAVQPKPRQAAKPRAQAEYSGIVYGQRHLVREGQTLTGIASRIRPQGLTLEQTVQALVNANPEVFINNNADRMLAGKVLSIPSRAEFDKYLSGQTPAAAPSAPTDKATDAPAEPVQTPASAPAETQASVPSVDPAAVQQVEENQAPASAAVASDAAPAEAGPAEPAVTEPADQQAADDSDTGSLWRWLLLGGAALIGLYLLSKLLGRRRPQPEADTVVPVDEKDLAAIEDDIEEDISEFGQVDQSGRNFPSHTVSTAAASAAAIGGAAAAAHAVQKPADELELEDDFDDDIFFDDAEETAVEKQGDVDLDLNSIDTTQAAIVSGAVTHDEETEKRRHADWDAIESTESVYEPEPENPYAAADESAQTPVFEEAPAPVADAFVTQGSSERESWDFEVDETKAEVKEKEWDFLEDTQAGQPTEAQLQLDEEAVVAQNDWAATASSAFVTESAEAADFQPTRSDNEVPLEFSRPEPAPEPEPVIDATFEPAAELRDDTVAAEAAAEPELFHIQQAETLSLHDTEDFGSEFAPVAESDEAIEWDAVNVTDSADSSARDSGFISESVGMTAPLEAKYELAKMYVEIGDPEAARETLQELLEEADGVILTKAKTMLQELDA